MEETNNQQNSGAEDSIGAALLEMYGAGTPLDVIPADAEAGPPEKTEEEIAAEAATAAAASAEQPGTDDAPAEATASLDDEPAKASGTEGTQNQPAAEIDKFITADPDLVKFKINSKQELVELIEDYGSLARENEELQKKLENKSEYQFKSDNAKKFVDFLANFDGDEERAVAEYGHILSLNLATLDADEILREAFILQNKDLPRHKAQLFFDKREIVKYSSDDPDDQEILDIQKERDVNKAKQFLAKLKEEVKPEPKKAATADPIKQAQQQAYEKNSQQNVGFIVKSFEGFNSIILQDDDKNVVPFRIGLSPAQTERVKNEAISAMKSLENYDSNGNFKYSVNPEEIKLNITMSLYGKKMLELTRAQGKKEGYAAAIKERSGIIPEKGASGIPVAAANDGGGQDIYEQMANAGVKAN